MTEPENHTLAPLREMRAEIRSLGADLRDEIRASEERTSKRFDRIEKRIGAMHQNGIKALKGFVGHRSMVERTMASFEVDGTELKRRVDALEAAQS